MKQIWQQWSAKFNSLSLRERALIFVMAAVIMCALFNSLLLAPLTTKQQTLSRQLTQIDAEIQTLQAEKVSLLNSAAQDPHAAMKSRLAAVKNRLQEINGFLLDKQQQLISPNDITRVLEAILIENRTLQLIALHNLPMEPLLSTSHAETPIDPELRAKSAAAEQIYKHGVQIIVRGGYFDLLAYLDALEKIPARMFWDRVTLQVEEYPVAVMTLTVYTLSLDKIWLTV